MTDNTMHVSQQNEDGTWSPATPLKMPWHVRLSVWWHGKAKPWLSEVL